MTPTDEQRAAIYSDADRILCVSGPGSGKTATLINRVIRLVACGAQPENMAAITYTNSAAAELAARLAPEDGSIRLTLGFCGTLHSFCLRHLQQNGHEGATVLDQEEADAELQRVARDCNVDASLKKLKQMKANYHGWGADASGFYDASKAGMFSTRLVIGNYYRKLEAERLLDYDSILHFALTSLQRQLPDRDKVWEHLMVDEFQDASELDAEIYKFVLAKNRFYVGDPRQAIFGWRGASLQPFLRLDADPSWTKLPLAENFRSGREIVEAANRLMEHAKELPETARQSVSKTARALGNASAQRSIQSTVQARLWASDEAEASGIAEAIRSHAQPDCDYWRYAVLARTRAVAGLIATVLEESGVPVRKRVKADDREWKHAQAAVRALTLGTPDSVLRWLRCRMGEREIEVIRTNHDAGEVDIVKLYFGDTDGMLLWDRLRALGCSEATVEKVGELWATLQEKNLPNLSLAMAQAKADEETIGEGVFVGTIHGAKGQEWDYVVVAGCEEGRMPSSYSDLDEERRVMFVAMTRARVGLWITCAESRGFSWHSGIGTVKEMEPSRFIKEAGLTL